MLNFNEDKKSFCLTVDVEPDLDKEWRITNAIPFDGVYKGVTRIQKLCNDYGVRPTYFLNPVILKDEGCISFFKNLDSSHCELGTHLHGEYIEPNAKYTGSDFSGCSLSEMQCEYPEDLEFQKLKMLTELFVSKFGYQPKSFRAGRFGVRGWTMDCLQRLGYTHDSSVTPFWNWYNKVDFSKAKFLWPYYASQKDILENTDSGIIEVPVSITPNRIWLRPTPGYSDFSKLKEVVKWYERNCKNNIVLCCMFHNVELLPSKSPYCFTERDCKKMLINLSKLFKLLKKRKYLFSTVKEISVQ